MLAREFLTLGRQAIRDATVNFCERTAVEVIDEMFRRYQAAMQAPAGSSAA
jgi:hypothetical protein